jgi:hypothetical protein
MAEATGKATGQVISTGGEGDQFRFNLAKWIVIFSFGGISVLGLCAITMAALPTLAYAVQKKGIITFTELNQSYSNVKDILGILLPVISAWAGTVFAFYFSRENYETAARTSAALVAQLTSEEKLKSIIVNDVMIKIEDADKLILEKEPKEYKLKADIIVQILEPKGRERLPILDTEGRVKYVAHRSLIDKFIARKASEGADVDALTLQDMLDDKDIERTLSRTFCTVRAEQNLSFAKGEMEKVLSCADIFVTQDGTPGTKAIGWITDVIVSQQAIVK